VVYEPGPSEAIERADFAELEGEIGRGGQTAFLEPGGPLRLSVTTAVGPAELHFLKENEQDSEGAR
jgi:hypothetical protein